MSPSLRPGWNAVPAITLAAIAIAGLGSAASAAPTCVAPAVTLEDPGATAAGLARCRVLFTEGGVFVTPAGVTQGAVLVTAGGGGGNTSDFVGASPNVGPWDWGGGGGAGETVIQNPLTLTPGKSYTVTVGQGGAGATASAGAAGGDGEASAFDSITASPGKGGALDGAGGASGFPAGSSRPPGPKPGGGGGAGYIRPFPTVADGTAGVYTFLPVLGNQSGWGGMGTGFVQTSSSGFMDVLKPDGSVRRFSCGGGGFGLVRGGNACRNPGLPYPYGGAGDGGAGGFDADPYGQWTKRAGYDGEASSGWGGGGGGIADDSSRMDGGRGGSGIVVVDYFIGAGGATDGASGGGSGAGSGTLKATKPKVGPAGRVVNVTVTAPSAGTAQLTGSLAPSVTRVVCTARKSFTAAATARMTCVPGAGVQRLRRAKAVRVKIVVGFRPSAGGRNQTVTAGTVTLPKLRARAIPVTG